MATVKEYFDADFNHTVRVYVRLPSSEPDLQLVVLYDFAALISFFACYVPGNDRTLDVFLHLIESINPGSQIALDGKVALPSPRLFPGRLEIKNTNPFHCCPS